MNLKDKVVVITGASSGIGKALAEQFAKAGANVVAPNRSEMDVRDETQVIKITEETVQKFGHIDIWINNAGLLYALSKDDKLIDMEKAHEMMDVNFFGTVFGCRTALKNMKEGIIINILSSAALDATRTYFSKIYAASKWAVRGYLEALSAEYIDSKVKILSVYPGGTKTNLWNNYRHKSFDDFMNPSDVAEKIIANIMQENPEKELKISRPKK